MSRVEELLAGGDADVEDLDSDGQPFYFFVVGPCSPLNSPPISAFLVSGATPIILAAIGGHLPLVQVSLHKWHTEEFPQQKAKNCLQLSFISASDQPRRRAEPPGQSHWLDLLDAGAGEILTKCWTDWRNVNLINKICYCWTDDTLMAGDILRSHRCGDRVAGVRSRSDGESEIWVHCSWPCYSCRFQPGFVIIIINLHPYRH